jgi:bis(5'-nucleosyl)-tetraphosphatase (symmetrical)
MSTYVIGDVQGCYQSLQKLLEKIDFSNNTDKLWFVGDLVNRGPQSLQVLEFVSGLGNKAISLLGNHDFYLLALYYRAWPARPAHTLGPLLNSPKIDHYIEWLLHCPLVHIDEAKHCAMIHAGLYPLWTLEQAKTLADSVSHRLQSGDCRSLLENMYGNCPNIWSGDLTEPGRTRLIVNALTRMRYLHQDGRLDLHHKGTLHDAPGELIPWFQHKRLVLPDKMTLCFGHWASLEGECPHAQIQAVDTGCVWGKALSAYCVESAKRFSVPCQE